ncbi:DGQHR domain-containing protein [Raphidiopsis sp. BLCC-F218]
MAKIPQDNRNIFPQYPVGQPPQPPSQIIVQQTKMGNVPAYLGSVTLEWFAKKVKFASTLPILQNKYNPVTDNIEIDADSIEQIQERSLDWSRQSLLLQYLAIHRNHKFPPVLVVISQPWVNDEKSDLWDGEGRAKKATTDFTPSDANGHIGLLNVAEEDVNIYVLDGQHRLMGVQGLLELLENGRIRRYNRDKIPTDSYIDLSELVDQYKIDVDYLKQLPQEKIGIEFICAVNSGETYSEAKQRVRSIFVHVNLMATPLSKGQLIQLNEDNGFAIVARKIAVSHPLLAHRENRKPRINWNSATVAANSTVLTTLQALQDMSTKYLGYKFPHWQPQIKGLIPMRPDLDQLAEGIREFQRLFDHLATLPSYKILDHEDTTVLRRFSFEKGGGEGNILFRPVAQVALAEALGILVFKNGLLLENIFKKLQKFDLQGGFSQMEFPNSVWYGVLYDPNKKRVQVSKKELAVKLLIYLLGGIKDRMEIAQLRKAIASARTREDRAMDFDGNWVSPQEVGLPSI